LEKDDETWKLNMKIQLQVSAEIGSNLFIGAGGGSLPLLIKSEIPKGKVLAAL